MTRQPVKVPPCDVVLCVNAILINDSKKGLSFSKTSIVASRRRDTWYW